MADAPAPVACLWVSVLVLSDGSVCVQSNHHVEVPASPMDECDALIALVEESVTQAAEQIAETITTEMERVRDDLQLKKIVTHHSGRAA